jgi:glycosyltransferase involved in cell wall biosynthesis
VHTGIVQVLHVLNAFQWHEPSIIRFHPRHAFHVHAMRLLFRRSLRRCDAAVVETPWVAEGVRQIPLAPSRIVVIPKAVEDETDIQHKQIPQRMRGLFDGKLGRGAFTFLYVATNLPHKNIATLISAIEILRDRGEKIRLVLSVSEKDLRSIDSVQAADLVKCGYILPVGWVEKDFLRDLYDNSTACVMPSFLECLSSSYLEAMQWGKPQICSDMPFAHETCGSASVYADPNDPRDWADKMASLAHDPLLQSSLAEKGHWQIKQFPQSWSDVASRFHQLFEGLLSNRL